MAARPQWVEHAIWERLPVAAAVAGPLARAGVRVAARTRARAGFMAARPSHPYTWVSLTTAGGGSWRCRDGATVRSGLFRTGQAVIFPRRVPYWLEAAQDGWEFIWFSIEESQRPDVRHATFPVVPTLLADMRGTVDALLREWRSRAVDRDEAASLHASMLAFQLNRLLGEEAIQGASPIDRLIVRIAREPQAPWPSMAVASALGLSLRQAHRAILRQCQCTPARLVLGLRMRAAQDLLADRTLGLDAVARAVGYADASAFSHAFRRLIGSSPDRWRRDAAAGAPRTSGPRQRGRR